MAEFRTTALSVAAFAAYKKIPPDKAEVLSAGRVVFVWDEGNSVEANRLSSMYLSGDAHTTQECGGIDKIFDAYFDVRAMMFQAMDAERQTRASRGEDHD